MIDLNSARIFACVVKRGSFSGASLDMGIPIATVSRRVSELENSLKFKLLERSTRCLRLTDAGAVLYEHISRGVEEVDAGLQILTETEENLKGTIRLSTPPVFEPIWKLLNNFSALYPNIEMDIFVNERRLDFIEDGIDIALRIGDIASQSSVSRHLTEYRHKLVASPYFLEKNAIKNPKDLLNIKTAAWCKKHQLVKWQLGNETLSIHPFIRANDYLYMRFLALNNICVTELPPFFSQRFIASGELVEVLPEFRMPTQNIQLIYPSRKSVTQIMRVFIDYCVENFSI